MFLVVAVAGLNAPPSGKDALRVATAIQSPIQDISFLFEGHSTYPARSGVGQESYNYSGAFRFQRPVGWLGEVTVQHPGGPRETERISIGPENGWRCQNLGADNRPIAQFVRSSDWMDAVVRLSHAIPLSHHALLGTLPDEFAAKSNWMGSETIDGRSCQVIEMNRTLGPDHRESCRLSLDLEQGGVIRKLVLQINGNIEFQLDHVKTLLVPVDGRESVWMVVAAQLGYFNDIFASSKAKKTIYTKKPWEVRHFIVLPETIRINQGLSPDSAVIKFDRRFPVQDYRNAKPGPTETARSASTSVEELKQVIEDARMQAEDSGAPWAAPPTPGVWTLYWLPITLACLGAVIIAAAVWFLKRG